MSVSPEGVDAFLASRLAATGELAVSPQLRPATIDDGYAVQAAVHRRLPEHGDECTGYKIGCATAETRRPFGLAEPTYGGILRSTQRPSLARALSDTAGPFALECEIAVRMGDCAGVGEITVLSDVARCVAGCAIAAELVQNRYVDPVATGVATLVADDFFHYRYVVGGWRHDLDFDQIARLRARVWADGALVDEALSSNVMGNPLASVAWLAQALRRSGRRLREGDVILTGAIVAPHWVRRPPASLRLSIETLGEIVAPPPHDSALPHQFSVE